MKVHLIDGTYELFRGYYGPPPRKNPDGREVGATVALLQSLIALLSKPGVTHIGCAFDHVIESFRNDLYAGYKTGEGIPAELQAQFSLAEEAIAALGITVWAMVDYEADDALATVVSLLQESPDVEQVVLCSPDKDLAQLVSGNRVVCWDRRRDLLYDEEAVIEKYGVSPPSIPDWLALVGDAADGIPGVPSWGAKSAATVLARYDHLEAIPTDLEAWDVMVRGAKRLHQTLNDHREQAMLYRRLATLRTDVPLRTGLDALRWRGPGPDFLQICQELGVPDLPGRLPSRGY